MSITADKKYHGEVVSGELIESQSGSLGYQVFLKCDDGETSYTIWLTAKNRERAKDVFVKALGVDPKNLQNPTYIENQLAVDIAGRLVTFVTEMDEYKGKSRIKVAWLFPRSQSAGGNPARSAAAFFGGQAPGNNAEITDDDIPF